MDAVIKLDTQLNELQQQLLNLNDQKQKILDDISTAKSNISDLLRKMENIDSKK
jgi:chromosome segregation ATPase